MRQPIPSTYKPETNEKPLWDLIFGALTYKAVLVAHRLRIFAMLADRPLALGELCSALKIERRPARAILTACATAGLLEIEGEQYRLTAVARDYLVESSPAYFGDFLGMLTANDAVTSFESLHDAVVTNKSQVYSGQELFKSHEEQAALARAFTLGMHGHSAGAAFSWVDAIDLQGHRVMLDVGGGSGIHAIAALRRWTNLRAIIFELPAVCDVASELAAKYELQARIEARAGDMWKDPFPAADVHFYADILHDWTPEKGCFLLKKSFERLPPGGRVLLHEVLYNDERTGPASAAAYSVAMLLWTEGQQYSGRELAAMLAEIGFTQIEITPTFGHWSVVSARKP